MRAGTSLKLICIKSRLFDLYEIIQSIKYTSVRSSLAGAEKFVNTAMIIYCFLTNYILTTLILGWVSCASVSSFAFIDYIKTRHKICSIPETRTAAVNIKNSKTNSKMSNNLFVGIFNYVLIYVTIYPNIL